MMHWEMKQANDRGRITYLKSEIVGNGGKYVWGLTQPLGDGTMLTIEYYTLAHGLTVVLETRRSVGGNIVRWDVLTPFNADANLDRLIDHIGHLSSLRAEVI